MSNKLADRTAGFPCHAWIIAEPPFIYTAFCVQNPETVSSNARHQCWAGLVSTQYFQDLRDDFIDRRREGELLDELAVWAEQNHACGVVDRLIVGTGLAHLGVANFEIVRSGADERRGVGEADDTRVEEFGIGLQDLRRVALGVNGDEERLQALGLVAELLQDGGHFDPHSRADVGAVSVVEGDELEPPGETLAGDRAAVRVLQQIARVDAAAFAGQQFMCRLRGCRVAAKQRGEQQGAP